MYSTKKQRKRNTLEGKLWGEISSLRIIIIIMMMIIIITIKKKI